MQTDHDGYAAFGPDGVEIPDTRSTSRGGSWGAAQAIMSLHPRSLLAAGYTVQPVQVRAVEGGE